MYNVSLRSKISLLLYNALFTKTVKLNHLKNSKYVLTQKFQNIQ